MTKQDKNIKKILETTQNDTYTFLKNQYHWIKFDNTPTVCMGVLDAVFQMVLELAPNKKQAIELITFNLEQLNKNN